MPCFGLSCELFDACSLIAWVSRWAGRLNSFTIFNPRDFDIAFQRLRLSAGSHIYTRSPSCAATSKTFVGRLSGYMSINQHRAGEHRLLVEDSGRVQFNFCLSMLLSDRLILAPVNYMSPERLGEQRRRSTAGGDVCAFGCLCYLVIRQIVGVTMCTQL
jgi:hypothetical protein